MQYSVSMHNMEENFITQPALPQTISGIAQLSFVKAQLAKERTKLKKRKHVYRVISNVFFYIALVAILLLLLAIFLTNVGGNATGANMFAVPVLGHALTFVNTHMLVAVFICTFLLLFSLILRVFGRQTYWEVEDKKAKHRRKRTIRIRQ